MRRLARRLFTLCSAVSLLPCLGVCVLWVRSYHGGAGVAWTCRDASLNWMPPQFPSQINPPVQAVEQYEAASLAGRLCFRHIGWVAAAMEGNGAGAENVLTRPSMPLAPPMRVSPKPGLAWMPRRALRMYIRNDRPQFLGFAADQGGWIELVSPSNYRQGYWDAYARAAEVPHWFLALVTAALPGLWFRRAIRTRRAAGRAARGTCGFCGYDLRASPERCPECGTPAK